jgi:hypothetical protein
MNLGIFCRWAEAFRPTTFALVSNPLIFFHIVLNEDVLILITFEY